MPARVSSPAFVGRGEELTRVDVALADAAAGQPRVVLVGGEAGVGKTRFVAHVIAELAAPGAHILSGGCVELGGRGVPYAPFVEGLRGLVRSLSPGARARLVDGAADLARLLPELGNGSEPTAARTGTDGGAAQGRLFELILGVLGRLGQTAPVLVVVEDLHWADQSSLDLLAFLARNLDREPVLLLATFRDDELHRRHPLRPYLAQLERTPVTDRVQLQPLREEEIGALLAGILGHAPPARLLVEIAARCEGNPFFAEELLGASTRGGAITRDLPPTLRDLLLARVESLPDRVQRVLRMVAAGGSEVAHGLVEAVAGDHPDLIEDLRTAVSHHVLVTTGDGEQYGFRHALVREAVYGDLLPGERVRLHAAYAGALASAPDLAVDRRSAATALVHHWLAALDHPRALPAAIDSGHAAGRVYAFSEAHAAYQQALELWDRVPEPEAVAGIDHAALCELALEAALAAGDPVRAVALARAALDAVDVIAEPVRAGLLHARLAVCLWYAGDADAAFDSRAEAARLVPATPPTKARARVLADEARALVLATHYARARERAQEALDCALAVGAEHEAGLARDSLGVALAYLGDPEAGLAHVHAARQVATAADDVNFVYRTCANAALALMAADRYADAAKEALGGVKIMARLGGRLIHGSALQSVAAFMLVPLGRWDEAEQLAVEALSQGSPGMAVDTSLRLTLATVALTRGAYEGAAAHLDAARRLSSRAVESWLTGYLYAIETEFATWRDDTEVAIATALEGLMLVGDRDGDHATGRLLSAGARAAAERAAVSRALRDHAELDTVTTAGHRFAEAAAEMATRISARGPTPSRVSLAYCETALAEAERLDGPGDPDRWERLAQIWDDLAHPYHSATARWRQATAILAAKGSHGSHKEAAALLRAAATTAAALGATPLGAEVAALARRARISLEAPPRPAAPAPPAAGHHLGLTPREREVLALVAAGRTNRQIATALFISEKTASVHVTNILRKLACSSRVEAAGIAHRLGLTEEV